MPRQRKDLTGFKHEKGRLTAISFSHTTEKHQLMWNCVCDCGEKVKISGWQLHNGAVLSCGCLGREQRAKRAIRYEAFGEMKSLAEWAEDPRCVVELSVLKSRIQSSKNDSWEPAKAITTPLTRRSVRQLEEVSPTNRKYNTKNNRKIPLKDLLAMKT